MVYWFRCNYIKRINKIWLEWNKIVIDSNDIVRVKFYSLIDLRLRFDTDRIKI